MKTMIATYDAGKAAQYAVVALTMGAANKDAARKMAIVDALRPSNRAVVRAIGLYDFQRKNVGAYSRAKARAGIKGACAFTQRAAKVAK